MCEQPENAVLDAFLREQTLNLTEIFPGSERSCAIVTASPDLKKYKYGKEIDSHPVVIRLNWHQTTPKDKSKYKVSLGTKITHRMVNNALWSDKEKFYLKLELFTDLEETVIFNHFGDEWNPVDRRIGKRIQIAERMVQFLDARKERWNRTLILDPTFVQTSFEAYERGAQKKLKKTPTTGFVALVMLSRICGSIHSYGFTDPVKNSYHDISSEHKLIHKWRDDKDAAVPFFMYPNQTANQKP